MSGNKATVRLERPHLYFGKHVWLIVLAQVCGGPGLVLRFIIIQKKRIMEKILNSILQILS